MPDTTFPVRLSHILGHSGVGAVVHGAGVYSVVHDTSFWARRNGEPAGEEILYVERVRAALGIGQTLRSPPIAKEDKNKGKGNMHACCIPTTLFPSWARCTGCGALSRLSWRDIQDGRTPRCQECGEKREQLTWALAHPAGYLAEVPWLYLTHRDAYHPVQEQCKSDGALFLEQDSEGKHVLRCAACGAKNRFSGNEKGNFGKRAQQPWRKDLKAAPAHTEDGAAQVLAINDSRAHSPKVDSALVIPPESRLRKGTVVDRLFRNSAARRDINNARPGLQRDSLISQLADSYQCSTQDIMSALADIERGYPLYGKEENFTPGQLLESEFDAFLEFLSDQRDDEDLVTRDRSNDWHTRTQIPPIPEEIKTAAASVQHLVRVDRLKAICISRGFTRMGGENPVPPDIEGHSDWLPAIELYGEGIFLTLDETRLAQWENSGAVQQRMDKLQARFIQSGRNAPNPLTARFVLLHTLSHLLMRQIEAEGGYPAASLLERIYCSLAPKRMAGILIHVAVPDIAGSLGGLAELAEPQRFLGIFVRALEHARWCPNDPVCSEHDGQGPGLLNRAACHACSLVPEPACEYGNALLDRCFVKGGDGLPAFFAI